MLTRCYGDRDLINLVPLVTASRGRLEMGSKLAEEYYHVLKY